MRKFLLLSLGLLILGVSYPAAAQTSQPIPISVSSTGELGNGESGAPSISADGRFVAFQSDATNLVAGDTNGFTDIFLHDRQTGETRRISISTTGEQGNGNSTDPVISGNGRIIAYESDANNLVNLDTNELSDIFVFDVITGLTKRISISQTGNQANSRSFSVRIDYAGRYLVYHSWADNLVFDHDRSPTRSYIFDLVTENVIQVPRESDNFIPGQKFVAESDAEISGDGRIIVYAATIEDPPPDPKFLNVLWIYNRVLNEVEYISLDPDIFQYWDSAKVSYDGRFIAISPNENPNGFEIRIFDLVSKQNFSIRDERKITYGINFLLSQDGKTLIAFDQYGGEIRYDRIVNGQVSSITHPYFLTGYEPGVNFIWAASISYDGNSIAIASNVGKLTQVSVLDLIFTLPSFYHLAGRVTDARGEPLALVTIADGKGGSTRTDGNGYFWLGGYPSGPVTLTPEKEGYTFEPSAWNLSVFRDVAGYHFTASPEETLLEEARLDLGMPYRFNRGCANGEEACGGPYHGFNAGFCTDLILDAYTAALNYDLNFELQQDAYAHPEHYYRWRDARNAHDMWRFLAYSSQMLAPDADYLPGDIVFFDWSGDGEIDHVSLVSEVENGQPVMLLDATGVTDYNPSGLAAELDWLPFHTETVRGHARWDGRYQPIRSGPQAGVHALQFALAGGSIFLRVMDADGNALSFGENALPRGYYFDLDWEEIISVLDPLGAYTVEIRASGEQPIPYQFSIQALTDGRVTGRITANGIARPLEVIQLPFTVGRNPQGAVTLEPGPPLHHAKVRGLLRKP